MKRLAVITTLLASACTPREVATYSFFAHLTDKGVPAPSLDQANCVIDNESGGQQVVSRTGDYGVWQINRATWQPVFPNDDLMDPATNGAIAAEVYRRAGGWSPWVGARRCA